MNITTAYYSFYYNKVYIDKPCEVERETNKCYFTKNGRYLKSDIGNPVLRYPTSYPYIEIIMIDANESILRRELGRWFIDMANKINGVVDNGGQMES